jgi:ribose transport system ATP-binding protein
VDESQDPPGVAFSVQMEGIHKRFAGVVALADASFACLGGEVHGLVGENGAGKSTLVKILAGNVQPDGGRILFTGRPVELGSPERAIALGVSLAYQELSLMADLTAAQNVFFGRAPTSYLRLVSSRVLARRYLELFERLGIHGPPPNRPVRDLTLGERQLVEIAKALIRDPHVLILDEATSALDRADAEWLRRLSRRLASDGKAVIFISHKLGEVLEVADRITVFQNGRDVGTAARGETSTQQLVDLMLGKRISLTHSARKGPIGPVALEVKELTLGQRLRSVTFTLRKGEILGVGGLSGHGQGDLLRALYGIERASGSVTLAGRRIRIGGPHKSLRMGLALVPEDRATQGLLATKSVGMNITLSALDRISRFGFISHTRETSVVDWAMSRLSIKAKNPDDPVARLSGGNQQKVLIAKLLATQPRVLFLLDPTRGVDVGTKAEIYTILRQLASDGTAILFYSTDLDELVGLCDRVIVLRQGAIQAVLEAASLTEENLVRASMGEPVQTVKESA